MATGVFHNIDGILVELTPEEVEREAAQLRDVDFTEHHIKQECRRRILAVLKDETTQLNLMQAAISILKNRWDGDSTTQEANIIDTLEQASTWVRTMLQRRKELLLSGDKDYKKNDRWPAPPPGLRDLADSF